MFVYVICPTTTLLAESTTVTDGNFSKLCGIVHVLAATPCVNTKFLSTLLGPCTIPYVFPDIKLPFPSENISVASKKVVSPDLSANDVKEYFPKLFTLSN